ncbi:DUF6233 domain-containing protein [Streptomyces sp. NBC_01230]|uniref:DUF6233 domain-containing protein n=1 Tax=Streptomyces sp. NBC_01230 TaxID=2903784 RepID=UPI003FA37E56
MIVRICRPRQGLFPAEGIETGIKPWSTRPVTQWRLQHLPSKVGGPGRAVLHRIHCFMKADGQLNQAEARIAVEEGAELCQGCRPADGLGTKSTGS